MCGICGIINYDKANIDEGLLSRISQEMRHRGPDDEGFYIDNSTSGPCVGLGHRRLKIIDLSNAGHQPMSNEDKTVWLVFNGEVYNFQELRVGLEKKRHVFQSNTDTECVIHLYEEYGENCVNYLRGMFAFAIWDKKKETLILARDRVGKKPVLYYHKCGKFCFASEFSALLKSDHISKEINLEAIDVYLSFGYIPAPETIYKDIFKLPPAHMLILKDNTFKIKKYWDLNYEDKIRITEKEAAEEVLRLLKDSVRVRLSSDVPLGAFLSGGIDSSTIVALMSQLSNERVKTFSIGFEEQDYSELKYARNIAEKYNTEHHEFIVKPKALEVLPLLIERYGEPFADSSCIPTYYVAQVTRNYVTIALSGDGGDEIFAGYERYQGMVAAEIYHRLPSFVKTISIGIAGVLPDSVNTKNRLRNFKRFAQAINLEPAQRYLRWLSIIENSFKHEFLYSQDFKENINIANPLNYLFPYFNRSKGLNIIDRVSLTDVNTTLPNDYLVKVDIAAMANSLECRSPFLDHKFMEFVVSLPAEYRMKRFTKKYILKKAIKDIVPKENVYRRKMGFGVPVGEWFRGELKGFLIENLLSRVSLGRGYFRPQAIKNMINQHMEKKANHSQQLWALLMLELWHKNFID